jgi:hypothetical protein
MFLDWLKSPGSLLSRAPKIIQKLGATAKCQHKTCRHAKSSTRIFSGSDSPGYGFRRASVCIVRGASIFLLQAPVIYRQWCEWVFGMVFRCVSNGLQWVLMLLVAIEGESCRNKARYCTLAFLTKKFVRTRAALSTWAREKCNPGYPDPLKIRVELLACPHVLCWHFAVAPSFWMILGALESRDPGLFNEPKNIQNDLWEVFLRTRWKKAAV